VAFLDTEKIINGTPQKRLINGYNRMKENYTAESAQEYGTIYKNEPLSFLVENSRMIFSEPYEGKSYYENAMNENTCCFTAIESELSKVEEYLESGSKAMSDSQKVMYEGLENTLRTLSDNTKNTRMYASYIKEEKSNSFEKDLSDALFKNEDITSIVESVNDPIILLTYLPYVSNKIDSQLFSEKVDTLLNECSVPEEYNEDKWTNFVEAVICANKLACDKSYQAAVHSIQNRSLRGVFEYFMNESLGTKLHELVEEKVSDDIHFSSRVSSINNIFMDMMEATIDAEENEQIKTRNDTYTAIAYEATLDAIVREYQSTEDTSSNVSGYSLIKESMTLDDAFNYVNNLYQEKSYLIKEDSDEDENNDNELDELENEVNDDRTDGGITSGKKPQAPKPKNLANNIQFKAMDAEVRQQKKQATRKQKGQETLNAAKAVAQLPLNVVNSIKEVQTTIDKADDERRKKFMTEPGFRKKLFRNMKLAILYGTAAQMKLAFVPVVMVCRHFSKVKDRRIRNELQRELETEIRVCEEKINDANANGDQKEKYRLIRIKDQLDAEVIRVKTNSKYV
jgi:hypothetical protein